MAYNLAQTFYVDAQKVKGSPQVDIASVELYFKRKPPSGLDFNPNVSGIQQPGVTVLFCEVNLANQPVVDDPIEVARLEYDQIPISGDATAASKFVFGTEVYALTNKEYAFVVLFDGYEDFELWSNKKGNYVVGTTTVSSGTNDKYVGNLYVYQPGSGSAVADYNPSSAGSAGVSPSGAISGAGSWIPKKDEDLRFNIYVCRYADTGDVVLDANTISTNNAGGNTTTSVLTLDPYEYILFDRKLSQKEQKAKVSEYVYQNTSYHTGTVNIQTGNLEITGLGVDFTTLYSTTANNDSYIVVISEGDDPGHVSGNNDKINIRRIVSFNANNSITVDRYPSFTNAVAKFLLPTPVGRIEIMDRSRSFNKRYNSPSWYFSDRKKQDFVILNNSNANSSVKFVNNAIETITITAVGASYTNGDILTISSATVGSVNARATISTNATGNVTSVYITNTGAGMILTPTGAVTNSTGGASTGSGATFSYTEGPTLRTEFSKLRIKDIEVINWELTTVQPVVEVNNPRGTHFQHYLHTPYYKSAANTYTVIQNANANKKLIKNLKKADLPYSNTSLMLSRSNEAGWANTHQIQLANGTNIATTTTSVIEVVATSQSDFICPAVPPPSIISEKYIINNDYTNEHTPFGNADAKHVSTKISFQQGRTAEDVIVFLRAYRPKTTDIKVFVRIHNSKDPQAFDDKDWSLLDCTDGNSAFSSSTDVNDLREYTYNFPQAPNTYFTSPGVITTTSANSTLTGTNTIFTTGIYGFAAGDMVKLYSPLFPQNYMVSTVNSVTSNTVLVLTNNVTNTDLVGAGLKLDKLYYKNQAFNNIQNDNVVRYYNTSMHVYDGYDTFAVKIVLLAETDTLVPEVDDIRAIGVSA